MFAWDEELAQAFIKAQEEGFITELSPCSVECLECPELCEDCPANKACLTLSEGNYNKFLKNYRTKIVPLLKDIHENSRI